ncbi:MAG: uroporphyrinogen-III synthase, partial [Desulfovibrionaceae bacterium]
ESLRDKGISPDFFPDRYVAEGVVEGMLALGMKGQKLLLPRAREAREVLPDELRAAGAVVDVLPVYATLPALARKEQVLEMLAQGRIACVTFGSSSTVENFLGAIPATTLQAYPAVKLAAIGPITAQTLARHGLSCAIQPQDYTIPALVEALKQGL